MTTYRGGFKLPIPTETLKTLIEKRSSYLDVFADLSHYGSSVEGVTEFEVDALPAVSVHERFEVTPSLHYRYRSTLAHEYGHAFLHAGLYTKTNLCKPPSTPRAYASTTAGERSLHTESNRWMEWQAWRVCGGILLPRTEVQRCVADYMQRAGRTNVNQLVHGHRTDVIRSTSRTFQVSLPMAERRLVDLGFITKR
jgi:hypothetical protein